jgi:hypothetical protein
MYISLKLGMIKLYHIGNVHAKNDINPFTNIVYFKLSEAKRQTVDLREGLSDHDDE